MTERTREMDGERIEGYVWPEAARLWRKYGERTPDFYRGGIEKLPEAVPATLILHPQEPTAQKRTARPVSSEEKNDERRS